ncbi:hypothetical protein EsH8_XI_000026 [Colletotrichum jinshuiense]
MHVWWASTSKARRLRQSWFQWKVEISTELLDVSQPSEDVQLLQRHPLSVFPYRDDASDGSSVYDLEPPPSLRVETPAEEVERVTESDAFMIGIPLLDWSVASPLLESIGAPFSQALHAKSPSSGHRHQKHSLNFTHLEASFGSLDNSTRFALGRILRAVRRSTTSPSASLPGPGHRQRVRERRAFPLKHNSAFDLVDTALRLKGLFHAPVRIEYLPDRSRVQLKMVEGPLHRSFTRNIASLVTHAGRKFVPILELRPGSVKIQGEKGGRGVLEPDGGWTANRGFMTPHVVCEIAVSQTRKDVNQKLEEYILGSGGHVRAAIGIKVFRSHQSPDDYSAVLDNLQECWLCMYPSDFGLEAAAAPKLHLRPGKTAQDLQDDSLAPIRISFEDIVAKLRDSINLAIVDRDSKPPERLGSRPKKQPAPRPGKAIGAPSEHDRDAAPRETRQSRRQARRQRQPRASKSKF